MAREPLKLRALDAADLEVIGALLQDALVPFSDVKFIKKDRRFILVASRFKWQEAVGVEPGPRPPADDPPGDASFEAAEGDEPPFHRVNCGVCFDRVRRVQSRGLDMSDRKEILNLLTVQAEGAQISLHFSGGGVIRLEVASICCHIEDLGEDWPTHWRPEHAADAL